MATSCWGTMMSPSAGLRQALTTPRTYRLAITTITPLPAIIVRGTPAMRPTSPAQAPAALTTHWQPIVRSWPATASWTRTAVMRSPSRSIPTRGWRTSTRQPRASASAAIERMQRPRVDAAVGDGEGELDVGRQQGLAPVGGRRRQLLGGDARGPAALHELPGVGLVVAGQEREQTADVLDGVGGDPAQGGVLLDALPGRVLVPDRVAGAGVEQAVPAARGPGAEVEALDQHRLHAPQRQVAQDGHAGHPAADDHNVRLHQVGQGLGSRSRPDGGSNNEPGGPGPAEPSGAS